MDAAMSPAGTPDPEWVATREGYYPDRYKVTACGRVHSVDRSAKDARGHLRRYKGRELTPWLSTAGYPTVTLYGGRKSDRRTVSVHQLVKEAFHGRTPEGMEVLHVDGNPLHCHLDNLVFGTSAQNKADIARHGRNYWSNRDRCDWGHPLEGDNVVTSPNQPGRRRCVACTRAHGIVRKRRQRGQGADFREIADAKYAEIVAGTDGRRAASARHIDCPQGHLLIAPNLVTSNPGRMCKACSRAHGSKAFAKRTGRPFDFKAVADVKYAEIMAGLDLDVLRAQMVAAAEVPAVEVAPYTRKPSRRLAPKPREAVVIPDLPGEEWRDIVDYEGTHQVSNLARVKSLPRRVPYDGREDRWHRGKLFKPTPGRKGYLIVGLPDHSRTSKSCTHSVHKLVARAFLGVKPDGHEILHVDGDPSNARLDNLRYGTHRENGADMVRHGRTPRDRQGDECVHGHRLEAPNLVESKLPARKCLACTRAQVQESTTRRRSGHRKGCAESHQVRADRKYREIMGTETADDLARKERTACGRGHELIPSNLVQSKLPSRCCLACHRALSAARYERSQGRDANVQALADEHFGRILAA